MANISPKSSQGFGFESTATTLVSKQDRSPNRSDDGSESLQLPTAGSWTRGRKGFVVATGLFLNFNVTLSSSLPSGGSQVLASHFSVTDQQQLSLPVAIFLIGYIFGPSLFGPYSESCGRWVSLVTSFALYTLFTLACAFAPTWASFLLFRFLCGVGASGPQTVLSGAFADLYPSLTARGKSIAFLAFVSTIAPLFGPLIAGYTADSDWRWMFWITFAMALASWPFLIFLPETYEPTILKRQAGGEKEGQNSLLPSPKEAKGLWQSRHAILTALSRPFRMFLEPMVFFTDLFLVLEYTIFFLYFEAYPVIFSGTYQMTAGKSSLMLLPVCVGVIIAQLLYLWYDRYLASAQKQGKAWAFKEEYRRLPLVCLGGPLNATSQIWLAWSSRGSVHWSVPMLSGVLHGLGDDLIFVGLNNYLTDSYGVFSASAIASSVFTRYIGAAILLPLASYHMYSNLGVPWSCTILGLLCFMMSLIPFGFIRYGPALKKRSKFCQKLEERNALGMGIALDL